MRPRSRIDAAGCARHRHRERDFARQGLLRGSAVCFGLLTLVAGGVGIISLILYQGFMRLAGTVPKLWDGGYFVSLAGYILLVPGTILLLIGQTHVRQMVRLGPLRAP